MNQDQIDTLGSIIDETTNYAALSTMPAAIAQRGTQQGLRSIAHRLRALYVEIAKDDPWEGNPTFPPAP